MRKPDPREEWAMLLLAVQFLTRLPVPASAGFTPERLTASTRYHPLVGAFIGALVALIYAAALLAWPPPVAVAVSIAASLLLTGAFHEDGLADMFDGIGGGMTRERALEIMKDSRIGTYGGAALILALLLKATTLAAMPPHAVIIALITGHGLSRFSSVLVIATSGYVRDHGTAKPVADGVSGESLMVATATALVLWLGLVLSLGWVAALLGLAGLALGHWGIRRVYERKIGGYTGDCLGAVQQGSELGFYLGVLAWL
ncbi:adenosylcobinamide-GDP ribazoletransferase [Roseococcus sp. SDR]|uniref:adenosylcobinamide-GDP ribazoletransferase n=1 Tax=Roseococcus sp. SDR TaxID=2835532 RepID=UPI001BD16D8D|nr:adenosylcobinamide-GDP ribazoletransferase [Roseococcus sp. SDR]MBS7792850.1 adenosylcobinamide-GDP ribazoletransferase [Roseococcus sp. SDR]MBV1848164.1 adenosylcobinamide-GDP ribazoletransferase [Roseococcus sp. SDR]